MNDRIAVTGGTGWLAREFVYATSVMRQDCELRLFGRRSTHIQVGPTRHAVHKWTSDSLASWRPTTIIHLAYPTREHVQHLGSERYVAEIERLRTLAAHASEVESLRRTIFVSSGAAAKPNDDLYGQMKAEDEQLLGDLASRKGVDYLVARVWSVTGRFCTKPSLFLFYDLLAQVYRGHGSVQILSDRLIRRRYMDAGEFLYLAFLAVGIGWNGTLDSGGVLVEAGELANHMAQELGRTITLERPQLAHDREPSDYFADGSRLSRLEDEVGLIHSPLSTQILRGLGALRPA